MNFYAFNIGDYASATQHLSEFEDLAYRRLLDVYYVTEKPLPLDRRQVYRLVRAHSQDMREAVDVVLPEYFQETTEGWTHRRCEEEIAAAQEKSEKARASARKRWPEQDAKPSQSDGNATAYANAPPETCERIKTQSDGNAPNPNPNPNPNPISLGASDEFENLDAALRAIPGISKHPVAVAPVIGPIWQLVQQGYNLKTQILPSIERQARRQKPIRSWAFFVDGILEDNATKAPPAIDDSTWSRRLETARAQGQWDVNWGPMPKEQGCRVPPNLLNPEDGTGWTQWKPAA